MSDAPEDPPTPAEARLSQLLEPLRAEPPRSGPGMALVVVRKARLQSAFRGALRAVSQLTVAAADVLRLIVGRRTSKSRP
jgi:hypothetical protein